MRFGRARNSLEFEAMLKRIDYTWRLFATALSFSVFGIGGLFLGGLVFPVILAWPSSEESKRDRMRFCVNAAFTFFFWMMHYLGLLRYRVTGKELIKNDRSCLVIANHPTLIDVVALISLYPNACCIVKKELWSNFFMKRVLQGVGYIPNNDPEALMVACAKSLDRGDVLIIFPEGTRSVPGREMALQRGAAHIALRLGCPVRTVQITVEPITLTKHMPWYQVAERRVDFDVTIREFLSVNEYLDQKIPMSLASRRLTQKMRENIDIALTKSSL